MSSTQFIVYLALFIICLSLSAFFTSSETAFVSLQRIRLEHLVKSNVKGARRVARMIERPEKLLSTILLSNNIVQNAAVALGTVVAVSLVGERAGIIVATIIVSASIVIFSETAPKTLAIQHAEKLAFRNARTIEIISWLLAPFVALLGWIASNLVRLVGGKPVPRSLASPEEIRTMITIGHREGTVEESEARLLHSVFDFGDLIAREVMVPRSEVVWVKQGTKLRGFLDLYINKPLSRFPVYKENRDNIVGVLSVKDVLMALAKGDLKEESVIDPLIRPAYFAPETKDVDELFAEMRDKNYHLCVVVDEFGNTAGVVTLGQLIEEIVGPMGEELAEVQKDYEILSENVWQIDGSMRIEEANAEMGLRLPEGDYETVAGFVLHLLGRIPKPNEQIRYKNLKIVITEMRGFKIEKILITKEKPLEPSKETPREKDKGVSYEV